MPENLLHLETSPYLLQHRDNPVHWMPWGEEAFARARAENRPVLLSVGYAACHWCHVMAHESFEDDEMAALMNALFINIKVDREERPDIDRIYMAALHETGEHGGWPLTMFLTPEGKPFWGGTYFPKISQYGRPSFANVLQEVSRIFHEEHEKVEHNATALHEALNTRKIYEATTELSNALLDEIAQRALQIIDLEHGGLQGAPKFPQTGIFELIWRAGQRGRGSEYVDAIETTLTHICQGGIYDHLGGGFARYSVDAVWLAPHFEKMLYDNAQLIALMTLAWQHHPMPLFRIRIGETIEWVLREMVAESGAFAASLDADSEGEEGKFYVWSKAELDALLGADDAALFCSLYDISEGGNWEGTNIPNLLQLSEPLDADLEARLAPIRETLFRHRAERIPPGWDDKVLADWNGLMISALTFAGTVFAQPAWITAARQAFDVVAQHMYVDGHLRHSMRLGQVRHYATLDDYANMIEGALALYEATGDKFCLETAQAWALDVERYYRDPELGGYYYTSNAGEALITRSRSASDDAVPNANATMLANFARLHILSGDESYREKADALIATFTGETLSNIFAHATFFNAFDLFLNSVQCIIIGSRGDADTNALFDALWQSCIPNRIVTVREDTDALPQSHPAHGKTRLDGKATLYVCRGTTCSLPVTSPQDVGATLTA